MFPDFLIEAITNGVHRRHRAAPRSTIIDR